jgi:(E)-4-hydroxy-3-methylbut-2-enyl-diphosphate synthase
MEKMGGSNQQLGIGTLLEDGLGDTVRVSLTEDPEFEAPVAKSLVDRYAERSGHAPIKEIHHFPITPFEHNKRDTIEVFNFGGSNVPRVIADISAVQNMTEKEMKHIGHFYLPELDKWKMNDQGADYVFSGACPIPFMLPNGMKEIQYYNHWQQSEDQINKFPAFSLGEFKTAASFHYGLNFLMLSDLEVDEAIPYLEGRKDVVVILQSDNAHKMAALRRAFISLMENHCLAPVVVMVNYPVQDSDKTMLYAATDVGGLLVDGLGEGIMLGVGAYAGHGREQVLAQIKLHNSVGFGVLQAARTRMSKTEYISCPSCGRTLFDLQETTAMIRKRTDHLKGVKIGIMGCIVNGPGEMADADFGYVGSGKGKITLYKGKEVVKKSVPSERAVDELIEIIRKDGMWIEPEV